jgi:TonB family protein
MRHGIQGFLLEQSRFRLRLTALIVLASAFYSLPFLILLLPRPQQERLRVFIDRTPKHFGFEGPEEYVERVNLDARFEGEVGHEKPRMVDPVIIPGARRGGHQRPDAPSDAQRFTGVVLDLPVGAGNSEDDVMARAMRRAGSTPVFRSEQLVIETLVKPEYPEDARRQGIEGRVAFMALVDTLGQVAGVELITGVEGGILEAAAETAVRQTRLRPFRTRGVPQQVYAVFRYSFRLY